MRAPGPLRGWVGPPSYNVLQKCLGQMYAYFQMLPRKQDPGVKQNGSINYALALRGDLSKTSKQNI